METKQTLTTLSATMVRSAVREHAYMGPHRDELGRIAARPETPGSSAGTAWAGAVDALFQAIGFQARPFPSFGVWS
jgi:hypothetical protein